MLRGTEAELRSRGVARGDGGRKGTGGGVIQGSAGEAAVVALLGAKARTLSSLSEEEVRLFCLSVVQSFVRFCITHSNHLSIAIAQARGLRVHDVNSTRLH